MASDVCVVGIFECSVKGARDEKVLDMSVGMCGRCIIFQRFLLCGWKKKLFKIHFPHCGCVGPSDADMVGLFLSVLCSSDFRKDKSVSARSAGGWGCKVRHRCYPVTAVWHLCPLLSCFVEDLFRVASTAKFCSFLMEVALRASTTRVWLLVLCVGAAFFDFNKVVKVFWNNIWSQTLFMTIRMGVFGRCVPAKTETQI